MRQYRDLLNLNNNSSMFQCIKINIIYKYLQGDFGGGTYITSINDIFDSKFLILISGNLST